MPDGVRADKFGGKRRLVAAGGHRDMTLQDGPQAKAGDPLAVGVEEQGCARLVAVIALAEVGAHGVGGFLPQRADPFLASFAEDTHLAGCLQAHVVDVQAGDLGGSGAGVLEQGEQCPVTQAEAIRGRRRREQGFDLVPVEVGQGAC